MWTTKDESFIVSFMNNAITARAAGAVEVPAVGLRITRSDATLRPGRVVSVSAPDAHGDRAVTVEFVEFREKVSVTYPAWIFWAQWSRS